MRSRPRYILIWNPTWLRSEIKRLFEGSTINPSSVLDLLTLLRFKNLRHYKCGIPKLKSNPTSSTLAHAITFTVNIVTQHTWIPCNHIFQRISSDAPGGIQNGHICFKFFLGETDHFWKIRKQLWQVYTKIHQVSQSFHNCFRLRNSCLLIFSPEWRVRPTEGFWKNLVSVFWIESYFFNLIAGILPLLKFSWVESFSQRACLAIVQISSLLPLSWSVSFWMINNLLSIFSYNASLLNLWSSWVEHWQSLNKQTGWKESEWCWQKCLKEEACIVKGFMKRSRLH